MKIKAFTIFICFLILTACNKVKKPVKPEHLISENKMVNILVDVAIMSSAKGINKLKLEQNGIIPDAYIYKKNNIDSTIFAESNKYYAYDIKKYDAIYKRVKDSLNTLKTKYKALETKEKKEKKIKDSIKRAEKKKLKRGKNNKNSKPKIKKAALKPKKQN